MNRNVTLRIRSEIPADAGAIAGVTAAAFETLEISSHTEQFIVAALRAAKALTVSLFRQAGLQSAQEVTPCRTRVPSPC